MALIKTINANGSKGHHKFTLKVSEDSTSDNSSFLSYIFTIAPIQNGYDWNTFGSRISYSITIGSNTYTGTIPAYNGSSTVTLKSGSNIEIPHDSDGTKTIDIGFAVTDSSSANYTCGNASASDTFKLTDLHKAPELSLVGFVENDRTIGIDNLFVNNLSDKTFTVNYSFYDGATPSQLNIYTRSGTEIDSTATLNSSQATLNVNTIRYKESDVINNKVSFILELVDSSGGKKRITTPEYDALLYFGVNLESTACRIKRNGQASGQATLTLKGTWFNGQVGNLTNSLTFFIDYEKVGEQQTTHVSVPSSVNTGTGNNIEVNWLLQENGIPITAFDKRYSYIFYVTVVDTASRGLAALATLTLSKGVWLMAKFKNRVDFARLTVQNRYEIYPNVYSSNETIIGIDNDKPRYRKEIDFGSLPTANSSKSVAHNISDLSEIKDIKVIGYDGTRWFPIPFAPVGSMYSSASCSIRVSSTNIDIASSSNWSSYTAKVTLEYTKTSD